MTHRSKRMLALSVFVVIASVLVWNFSETKTEVRWLVSSRRYKAEVYAQPIPTSAEFKHIEWEDGAGQVTHEQERLGWYAFPWLYESLSQY